MNPDASKGINWGDVGPHPEKENPRTAYDVKEVHAAFRSFQDDELQRIPILPAGTRLKANATYTNLSDPERDEFTAEGREEVAPGDYIVPKAEVDYQLWNRLIGIKDPARMGRARK